jgi:hypothetical protein
MLINFSTKNLPDNPIYWSMVLQLFVKPWVGDQPLGRLLPAHSTAKTQNKRTQIFMPQVRFKNTIPAFERTKRVHDLRGPYTWESGWRVRLGSFSNKPNSSVCGSQSWESAHAFLVKLIRARLASQTPTCMGPFRPRGHFDRHVFLYWAQLTLI